MLGSSLFCEQKKVKEVKHFSKRQHLFILGQSLDPEALCSMEESRETLLVYADLAVVDELDNTRELLVLDVLQYDDRVLPGGQVPQHLNSSM